MGLRSHSCASIVLSIGSRVEIAVAPCIGEGVRHGFIEATVADIPSRVGHPDLRTVGGKTQDLDFNAEGSLEKVTEADKSTTGYLNDAAGDRLIRRDAGGTTLHLGETELRLDKASGKVSATRPALS